MRTHPFGTTGIPVAVIGQGTWNIGDVQRRADEEIRALRTGIDLGMTHIDTAEMYGSGKAEALVARAIEGRRHDVFLASKVLPSNASFQDTIAACERSLSRLKTDYLDLYLLHWWSEKHPVEETMSALEQLVDSGKVRFIGVSNLEIPQLQQALRALTRHKIACNQVCYHLEARGIEFSLIPWCESHGIAVVGYSPFGSGRFTQKGRHADVLSRIGTRHGKTLRQVALNFLSRRCFTIPKSSRPEHTRENAGAADWELTREDLDKIEEAFPSPTAETPLEMI
jgi:diketogulonate reductase-like aldo/keto reductase